MWRSQHWQRCKEKRNADAKRKELQLVTDSSVSVCSATRIQQTWKRRKVSGALGHQHKADHTKPQTRGKHRYKKQVLLSCLHSGSTQQISAEVHEQQTLPAPEKQQSKSTLTSSDTQAASWAAESWCARMASGASTGPRPIQQFHVGTSRRGQARRRERYAFQQVIR